MGLFLIQRPAYINELSKRMGIVYAPQEGASRIRCLGGRTAVDIFPLAAIQDCNSVYDSFGILILARIAVLLPGQCTAVRPQCSGWLAIPSRQSCNQSLVWILFTTFGSHFGYCRFPAYCNYCKRTFAFEDSNTGCWQLQRRHCSSLSTAWRRRWRICYIEVTVGSDGSIQEWLRALRNVSTSRATVGCGTVVSMIRRL